MQLPTLEISAEEARLRMLEYRELVDAGAATKEDEAILQAYRRAAKGARLIHLPQTIVAGGTTTMQVPHSRWDRERNRSVAVTVTVRVPMLTVARADTKWCWTTGVKRDGSLHLRFKRRVGATNKRDLLDFAAGTFPTAADNEPGGDPWNSWSGPRIRAMMPTIPPRLRPRAHLRNFHVLWEAVWGLEPSPPVDPALLKHVGGDLYAVLGVWDLTPIERAVLSGRTVGEGE